MPRIMTKQYRLNRLLRDWNDMADKYSKKAAKDLNKIARLEVWKWYNTYTPKYYNRKRTLYYAFDITGKNGIIKIHFGAEKMYSAHFVDRISSDYIFENSFMRGYHGGAISGLEHPNPGIPYWRTPYPIYENWSFPAARDTSPYDKIIKEIRKYEVKIRSKITAEFKRKLLPELEYILSME